MNIKRILSAAVGLAAASLLASPVQAQAPKKPNIVIIWGDDIGQSNVSAYSRGMMGYQTPNIDRVASEGVPSRVAPLAVLLSLPGSRACAPG